MQLTRPFKFRVGGNGQLRSGYTGLHWWAWNMLLNKREPSPAVSSSLDGKMVICRWILLMSSLLHVTVSSTIISRT